MSIFLVTSYAPITSNDNILNIPIFVWVYSPNLSDLLRPVDARSIILGIFDPFIPYLPHKISSSWARYIYFEKKLPLNLMCFKLPSEYGRLITL